MNKQQIRLYYMYFIPITILQSISTLLIMTVFTVEDYGNFTIYQTNLNFLLILTLGLQSGYTLKHSEYVSEDNHDYTLATNLFANGLAIVYVIMLTFANQLFEISGLSLISGYTACVLSIYFVHKSIFETNYKIHQLNIYILLFRLIFLFDTLIYFFIGDLQQVLVADLIMRTALVGVGNIIVFATYKNQTSSISVNMRNSIDSIKLGMPVMLGNWLTMMYLLADKYVLRSDKEMLGLYSFAITIVLLFRVLITPLKDLIFVSMAKNEKKNNVFENCKQTIYLGMILVITGGLVISQVAKYTTFLEKYHEAIPSLLLLLVILPINFILDLYLFNNERVKNSKLFLMKSLASGIIMFGVLQLYVILSTDLNLLIFSSLVVFCYNAIFMLFRKNIGTSKEARYITLRLLAFEMIYILFLYFII